MVFEPECCLAAGHSTFAHTLPFYISLRPFQEAAALVENPSLALTRENPLSALRRPEEGSTWHNSGLGSTSTWPRELNDTACSILVEDLQADVLPCYPLQRNWPCCRCVIRTGPICTQRGTPRVVTSIAIILITPLGLQTKTG